MHATRDFIFRFGRYVLDLRRGCLLVDEREVALRPKSFGLLRYLVENAGRLVTKDELLEAIWPDVTVTDESISRCMSDVRHALGDNGHHIVRTVPRRGYLLDVLVAAVPSASTSQSVSAEGRITEVACNRRDADRPPTRIRARATAPLSILVLPFTSLGENLARSYLADVITDSLIARLARIEGAFVISRSTAAAYNEGALDVGRIRRELGVSFILSGKEQHCGARVRVTAQLADTQNGACLWADQVDADLADLLDMQDAIVTRLARALHIELLAAVTTRPAHARGTAGDAEELALRGEAIFARYGTARGEAEAGYYLCERALALDHGNIRALSILAEKHATRVTAMQTTDREADIARAEFLASQAVEIDPRSCHAHHAKARVLVAQKRAAEAIVEAQRSLQLNPSFVPAYLNPCQVNLYLGRPGESIIWSEAAVRLSPFDPYVSIFHAHQAYAWFMLHEDERAADCLRRALAHNPEFPTATAWLASLLALSGKKAEAGRALRQYFALRATRTKSVAQWRSLADAEGSVYSAFRERLFEGLCEAGMPE